MKEFTREDRQKRIILIPQMLEYHSALLGAAFEANGYRLGMMRSAVPPSEKPLRYISSDYCYPSVLILGQVIEELERRNFDCSGVAFMEPQAGGSCRAGNIYNMIIEVTQKLGCDVPVISLNYRNLEKHSGFKITPRLVNSAATAVCCGDLLMLLYQQTKPYEAEPGRTEEVYALVERSVAEQIKAGCNSRVKMYREMISGFDMIPKTGVVKKRVCVAGEIYMKFSSLGNHGLERFIIEKGFEPYFGGFLNYLIYVADSERRSYMLGKANKAVLKLYDYAIRLMERLQGQMFRAVREQSAYRTDLAFEEFKKMAEGIISHDCINGDGWLVAAEAVQAVEGGCENVLIVHPFGCLVSHVCERGIMKNLKERYPRASIHTVEYDYDQSGALRESRVLLGLSGGVI